ncbi:MAG: TRAP transporter substrate-binding protein DctP [Desulfobacterales bacterium]|nr:TRAP transporter substrate-binding protein DctP [Desulfobacterales bacterium]
MNSTHVKKIAVLIVCFLGAFAMAVTSVHAKSVTLKLATADGSKGTPAGNAMEYWAKLIEEKSSGTVKVNVYFQGELGGQQEVFDQFVMGDIDLMLSWPMTSYDKRISVLYTPYMVLSWEDAMAAYAPGGWLNKIIDGLFADLGLKFFGPWPEGFNGIATRGSYATTIEGAKGIKVRTPPAFPFAHVVQTLGYQTADIAWNELYTAIQTGVVDGDAANIIFWDYEYFRDVIQYYVHTKQQFMTANLVANLEAFNRLSKENRDIVAQAAKMVMEKQFKEGRDLDLYYRQKAIDHGIKYIPLSKEEHTAAIKAVRAEVWPEMEKIVGKKLMDQIRQNASKM